MFLRVLGRLEVEGSDGPVSVGGHVPRRVLSALLVRAGAVVPADVLLAAVWGDQPPATGERTLQSHLTRVREALTAAGGTTWTFCVSSGRWLRRGRNRRRRPLRP